MPSDCAAFTSACFLRSVRMVARSDFAAASASGEDVANEGTPAEIRTANANQTERRYCRTRMLLRPEGATTNQPRATPWVLVMRYFSPERAIHSIPHIPFIKFNSVPFEQCTQFILEGH